MSLNIIDLIKGQLGPALVSQAAAQYGESESGISKAISGLLPAVVGGMANNADNPSVLDGIMGSNSSGLLGNLLTGSSNNSLITTILTAIFGDKIGGLVNSISSFAGVNNSTANSLLNVVTGATLGSVGKYAADNNLDRGGVASLLKDQRGVVSSLLPAGLSLASLGFGNWFGSDDAEKVRVTTPNEPKVEVNRGGATHVNVDRENNDGGGSIWKWLLPIILLVLAGWFLWKNCEDKDVDPAPTEVVEDSTVIETDTTMVDTNRETTTVTLPNGTTLNAYRGGIEDQMVAFLNSGEYQNMTEEQLKEKWFNFDNLNFEFDSPQITPDSRVQLDNIKAILAAYPDAKMKIGAYSDRKGDDAYNKELSQKRADAVKTSLNSAQVVDAEGYGEERAKVDENASDEERESDRYTAIRFVK